MLKEKEEIEKRKLELQKQLDDLVLKINQGKQTIANMEATMNGLQGAIQQCNWTLDLYKEEKSE
jgi:predicted  nucleic acid-binding Zn-ribbon protein|tara:strand:+ start:2630 stop:2821 length:192 start_codon:yes stop_codon:yes gene_type:complete